MYRLPSRKLPQSESDALKILQDQVDRAAGYAAQVSEAKSKFDVKPIGLFAKIRKELSLLSGDLVRCAYCEDSCADEVEHIRPKDFFPNLVFSWENYLYSCGPCNGGKNNKYPIWNNGSEIDLRQHRRQNGVVPPPPGLHIFIDPRTEDPMDYIWLDLTGGSFMLSSLDENSALPNARAQATIEILRLNREPLRKARANAYGGYVDRLEQYVRRHQEGAGRPELESRSEDISRCPHRTVWLEIKRQKGLIPRIEALFEIVPDAELW